MTGTQATVAAAELIVNGTRALVNSTETAVVASQAHPEDEKLLQQNITDITGNMNYNFVSSSRTKKLFQAASLCITNVRKHSERLTAAILDSVNSSENINNSIQRIGNSTCYYAGYSKSSKNNVAIIEMFLVEIQIHTLGPSIQPLFALFPTPGLQWRFITVNASNINTFVPQGNTADTTFNTTLSKFYNVFDFSKFPNLKIRSAQDLSNLHEKSNKVFINEVKTDGYTCRFTFVQARRRTLTATATTTKLELQDFTKAEIDQYFRPCTLDPGRTQVFTSYHGNGQLRQGILLFQGYYIQSKITRLNQSNHRNQTN
ncbi:hypothetical protein BD770DRAFT_474147 [Pilaira anomala]|nr:hypothetical protein BD770DRAFT_474147 [Pilaira anomala]